MAIFLRLFIQVHFTEAIYISLLIPTIKHTNVLNDIIIYNIRTYINIKYIYIYLFIYVCMYICICMYVHMYMYVCVCIIDYIALTIMLMMSYII